MGGLPLERKYHSDLIKLFKAQKIRNLRENINT